MGPIPARIFWPGFCALLLLMSLAGGVGAVVAAQSDGGAQILESYHQSERAPGEIGEGPCEPNAGETVADRNCPEEP